MHMQGRGMGIQPLPSAPSPDEEPLETQASMPQVELTRDVQDLNNDQLQEVLEALQIEMAWRQETAPTVVTPEKCRGPWGWQ